jgi:Terminase large subunit, T4likevirus-type, N-terminal
LDAVAFAEDSLAFRPDPWQAQVLRSARRQVILNCCRQSGKSTTTAILSLHTAIYEPSSLILLVSPSQRQSRELFQKVTGFLRALEPVQELEVDNRLSATLTNGSRIVSLPGDPRTVRGYSAPRLIILDEAAHLPDDGELYTALRPMLAVSGNGRLVLLSTPNGRRGNFFEIWTGGEGWERVKIVGKECPRITAEFLENELQELGPQLFSQEYEGQFIDADASAFSSELIEMALVDDFERFLAA